MCNNPQSPAVFDTGLYAGLQAEVICAAVEAPFGFYVSGSGDDLAVQCVGPSPDILINASYWFQEEAVSGLRALLRAATLDLWRHQYPKVFRCCDEVEIWWEEAIQDLRLEFPTWDSAGNTPLEVWYVASTCVCLPHVSCTSLPVRPTQLQVVGPV